MERGNGGLHLEIEVNREHKIVSVWLCKSDRESVAVHTVLKQMHETCKKNGYTVAQFHSGGEELYDTLRELYRYNRRRAQELPNHTGSNQGLKQIQC